MGIPAGVKVELAVTTAPFDPAPAWTDITAYVVFKQGIKITRGRPNESGVVQAGTLSLTLDNTDGRFSAGYPSGAYYPNIKVRKKIRVTTVAPAAVSSRFTGYVDEWPTEWPGGGDTYSTVQITAVDRFKPLSRKSALTNVISQEYLLDAPASYYTLGEPAGSVTAGDTSKVGTAVATVAQLGSGGTIEFAESTGPGTDGLSAPLFTRVDGSNGKYLEARFPAVIPDGPCTLECFFNTTSTDVTLVSAANGTSGVFPLFYLAVDSAGKLNGYHQVTAVTSAASVNDGATHHAAIVYGGGTTVTVYLDGVSVGTSGSGGSVSGSFDRLLIGVLSAGLLNVMNGTLAHAAFYQSALSAARILAHAQAGLTGFEGERSDQRIARFAAYAGIPTAEQNLETGLATSISKYDTTGKGPLAAMQDITATESGVLQIAGDGKLNFQARSHRYNAVSSLTIPAKFIGDGVRFPMNDQLLINDVTASRPEGITYRSVDQASVDDHGEAKQDLTLYVTSDNDVISAADWNSHRYSTPTPRISNLTVDIHADTSLASGVLGLDVGSMITVTGLPAQAPASSVDLFIEGWTETITPDAWGFEFNTSPGSQSAVWQLDSATYSQLGVSTVLGY